MTNRKFSKILLCCLAVCLTAGLYAQQADMMAQMRKVQTAMFAFNALYVDSVDNDLMTTKAIQAMVKELDPHSDYMTAEEVKEMNEPLQGTFDGIGISFNMMNDTLFVVEVIAGGPSEKVGLQAGDRILKVDGEPIAGVRMSNKEVMKRLKGPKGTRVTVSVKRRGTQGLTDFVIVRDKIPVYSIDAAYKVDRQTAYIKISRFGATTMDEFRKAFAEMMPFKTLILDLQSNGGGYMQTAVELADQFLDKGKCIVYSQGLHMEREDATATVKGAFEQGNLIILIDEYSASSSEIVTGAVQDWDRGLVVGRRSFGKGLVQRMYPLGDGSVIKLTVSRYYTPSGRCIQKPYDQGKEAYGKDLIDRYNRGEFLSADSIHFPDSLRYATLVKGRTVYGGGGIMPDVFVPLDTTRMTDLHRKLIQKGILNRFVLNYVDTHRADLKAAYPTADDFRARFQTDDALMEELLAAARADKFSPTEQQLAADQSVLRLQLKAYIARDLYTTAEFYKVMAPENDALQEALRILSDRKRCEKYGLR